MELQRLTAKCAFGAYLDEALRDRLVCDLQNEQIQRGLLAEADLNLEKAIKRVTTMDVVQSQAQAMKALQQVVGRVGHHTWLSRGQIGRGRMQSLQELGTL